MMGEEGRQATRAAFGTPVLAVILTITGCGGTTQEVATVPAIEQYRVVRIAVLPFTVAERTPGQERGYATPPPAPGGAEKLTDLFYLKLNAREGISVVPPSNAAPLLTGGQKPGKLSIREIGQKLDVDAVLIGTVEIYKERQGSKIGLERAQDAAEVGFVAKLVSTKDGATLWTGEYYERQRPLTEDLSGFLERGAKYLTVEQLADSAVDHVLKQFPLGRPYPRSSSSGGTAP
jgi:TolB-like protein